MTSRICFSHSRTLTRNERRVPRSVLLIRGAVACVVHACLRRRPRQREAGRTRERVCDAKVERVRRDVPGRRIENVRTLLS